VTKAEGEKAMAKAGLSVMERQNALREQAEKKRRE
jgi:hypothetical protein